MTTSDNVMFLFDLLSKQLNRSSITAMSPAAHRWLDPCLTSHSRTRKAPKLSWRCNQVCSPSSDARRIWRGFLSHRGTPVIIHFERWDFHWNQPSSHSSSIHMWHDDLVISLWANGWTCVFTCLEFWEPQGCYVNWTCSSWSPFKIQYCRNRQLIHGLGWECSRFRQNTLNTLLQDYPRWSRF